MTKIRGTRAYARFGAALGIVCAVAVIGVADATAQVTPGDLFRFGIRVLKVPPAARRSVAPSASTKTEVAEIQARLNELGYDAGPVDGQMGRRTRQSITAFQRDRGLSVTGRPDAEFLAALHAAPRQGNSPAQSASQAASPAEIIGWRTGGSQGYVEYVSRRGKDMITISCDVAASMDGSGTGIYLELGGKPLPPRSELSFDVDGKTLRVLSDASGGFGAGDCPACASKWRDLWPLLRAGKELTVTGANGASVVFPLAGLAGLLPVGPCATPFDDEASASAVTPRAEGESQVSLPAADAGAAADGPTTDAPAAKFSDGNFDDDPHPDVSCANRPPADSYAIPLQFRDKTAAPPADLKAGFILSYSLGQDVVLAQASDKATAYSTEGGADLIFIDDPDLPVTFEAGAGADTIVVCGLHEKTNLYVGRTDAAKDIVVLDAPLFEQTREMPVVLEIGGLTSLNDEVIIRLPAGMRPTIQFLRRSGQYEIVVGTVVIKIQAVAEWGAFYGNSIRVVSADGSRFPVADIPPPSLPLIKLKLPNAASVADRPTTLRGVPIANARVRLCPEPTTSITPEPLPFFGVPYNDLTQDDGRRVMAAFGPGNDTIVVPAVDYEISTDGGAGDDTIAVFGPHTLSRASGGNGADTILLCGPGADSVSMTIALGGGGTDVDPDTLVIDPSMLEDIPEGFYRLISVHNFTPANDQLVLRLPSDTKVNYEVSSSGSVTVLIGRLHIIVYRADAQRSFNFNSIVLVPATYPATPVTSAATDTSPPTAWRFGPAKDYLGNPTDGVTLADSCADIADGNYDFAMPATPVTTPGALLPDVAAYSHGDDLIRLAGTRERVSVEASSGDDRIYLIDVGDNVTVAGGPGADTFVLCSMHGSTLWLLMGRGGYAADRAPDRVVIEPSVFLNIPEGIAREIWIMGFLSFNDRLELRLPAGVNVETLEKSGGRPSELRFGQVIIRLNAGTGGAFLPEPGGFDPSSIAILTGQPQ